MDEKKLEKAEEFSMPWGKFVGKQLKELPNSYIEWLAANSKNELVAEYADLVRQWKEKYGIEID